MKTLTSFLTCVIAVNCLPASHAQMPVGPIILVQQTSVAPSRISYQAKPSFQMTMGYPSSYAASVLNGQVVSNVPVGSIQVTGYRQPAVSSVNSGAGNQNFARSGRMSTMSNVGGMKIVGQSAERSASGYPLRIRLSRNSTAGARSTFSQATVPTTRPIALRSTSVRPLYVWSSNARPSFAPSASVRSAVPIQYGTTTWTPAPVNISPSTNQSTGFNVAAQQQIQQQLQRQIQQQIQKAIQQQVQQAIQQQVHQPLNGTNTFAPLQSTNDRVKTPSSFDGLYISPAQQDATIHHHSSPLADNSPGDVSAQHSSRQATTNSRTTVPNKVLPFEQHPTPTASDSSFQNSQAAGSSQPLNVYPEVNTTKNSAPDQEQQIQKLVNEILE